MNGLLQTDCGGWSLADANARMDVYEAELANVDAALLRQHHDDVEHNRGPFLFYDKFLLHYGPLNERARSKLALEGQSSERAASYLFATVPPHGEYIFHASTCGGANCRRFV